MVQPKYSPEEALERVKLMMKYDLSKTSTENKKVVSEQTTPAAGYTDPNQQSKLRRKDSMLDDIIDNQSIDKSVCTKYIRKFYTAWLEKTVVPKSILDKERNIVQACRNQHYGKFGVLGVGGENVDDMLDSLAGCPNKKNISPSRTGDDKDFRINGRC